MKQLPTSVTEDGDSGGDERDPETPLKRTRTRNGCLNCRRKRRKCDESKPTCKKCHKSGDDCQWQKISFRPQNVMSVSSDHPSMLRQGRKRTRNYEIIDVTNEISREYPAHQSEVSTNRSEERIARNETTGLNNRTNMSGISDMLNPMPPIPALNRSTSFQTVPGLSPDSGNDLVQNRQFLSPYPQVGSVHSNNTVHDASGSDKSPHTRRMGPLEEEPEDTRMSNDLLNSSMQTFNDDLEFGYSPEFMIDDGIFLPGSTYQELHKTLRSHVFSTARSKPASPRSPGSPDIPFEQSPVQSRVQLPNLEVTDDGTHTPPELTKHQEYLLWKNWIEEISAWLDKFDKDKHFRHTLPTLAKEHAHLRYAIFALSARQLERKDGSLPASISLALYQEAIHRLLPKLHTKDVAVVASCVVLCVLEMFSCSPKAWRRHLDGCASLMQAINIRGDSGGLEEALFWCFARMDVCGGLISSERTLIPIERWTSNATLEEDIAVFQSSKIFEDHANYALYLLAQVLDFFARSGFSSNLRDPTTNARGKSSYSREWSILFDCIEKWHESRPNEMKSVLSVSADPSSPESNPFPTLLYGNGAATSGNQIYHTAALLMLQKKPRDVEKKSRSILWHARQICGISMSNDHHGCWTNCIQPLWIAGRIMSHPSEHRAIIEIYERIERETGWGAAWRVDDLKDHWGDLED